MAHKSYSTWKITKYKILRFAKNTLYCAKTQHFSDIAQNLQAVHALWRKSLSFLHFFSKSLHFLRFYKSFALFALCQKSLRFLGNPCAIRTFPQDFVLSQKVVLLDLQLPMMTILGVSSMHFLAKATDIFYAKNLRFLLSFLFASFLLSKLHSFFLPKTFSFNLKPIHCLVQLMHSLNNFRIQNSHTFYAKKCQDF